MKGKLTKLSDNDNALRTPSVEGVFTTFPKEGHSFCIIGKAISEEAKAMPDSHRLVSTSAVKPGIKNPEFGVYTFDTMFSTYRLEVDENDLEGTFQ